MKGSLLNGDVQDTSRLDDYRRQEIAMRRALRELRWYALHDGDPAPTSEQQAGARERALGHLRRYLDGTGQ